MAIDFGAENPDSTRSFLVITSDMPKPGVAEILSLLAATCNLRGKPHIHLRHRRPQDLRRFATAGKREGPRIHVATGCRRAI
jgi:hypothetical protein